MFLLTDEFGVTNPVTVDFPAIILRSGKLIISQETASRKDIKWVVEERSNLERESKVTED